MANESQESRLTTIHPSGAHIPRGKIQPGARIPGRHPESIAAVEREQPTPADFMAKAFADMQRNIQALVKASVDETLIVDEYQSQAGALSTAVLSLQPTYEFTERIEAIFIHGPAGACTVTLGDRVWSLTIPAAGYIILSPLAIYLGRTDVRSLSIASAGDMSFELMGHADRRWST